mgnify:CR=1 FL=1
MSPFIRSLQQQKNNVTDSAGQTRPSVATRTSRTVCHSDGLLRRICLTLLAFVVALATLAPLSATAGEKERQAVSGLLRLLIESQTGRPQPRAPGPTQLRPSGGRGTPELIRSRKVYEQFRDESAGLSTLLQQDVQRHPGLTTFVGDSVRLHAVSEATAQRSVIVGDHRQILEDTRRMDRDWRVLSYRLKQAQGISKPCRECVARLDGINSQLCGILSIEPQIDRHVLQRHGQTLAIYSRALIEDINFELRRSPARNSLQIEAAAAQQSAQAFADDISRGAQYDELVAAYRSFLARWEPLARKLCSFESRYVERSVLRIQEVDQKIHELLWLPRGIDRQQLLQLTAGIGAEIERVLNQTTLKMLVENQSRGDVVADADQFYGMVQNFQDCIAREVDVDELVEAYEYLPIEFVTFSQHYQRIRHDGIQQSFREIEQRITALREPLGIPGGFSLDRARERAASIEHLAEHLEGDIAAWLQGATKYDNERRGLLEDCRRFRTSARVIHTSLLGASPEAALRIACADAYERWLPLHRRITECDAPDREHVAEIMLRMNEELIQIEAMLLQ